MKRTALLMVTVVVACCGGVVVKSKTAANTKAHPAITNRICLLAGALPTDIKYERLARVIATKRSYGSTDELLPRMADEARMLGADAIINLQSDQRFKGPLPWRVMSPTGDGTAVKVAEGSPAIDCAAAGDRSL